MVTLWLISNSPLVSVMVPCSPPAKAMVSPLLAAAMAARSDPAPLSLRFSTVKVEALTRPGARVKRTSANTARMVSWGFITSS